LPSAYPPDVPGVDRLHLREAGLRFCGQAMEKRVRCYDLVGAGGRTQTRRCVDGVGDRANVRPAKGTGGHDVPVADRQADGGAAPGLYVVDPPLPLVRGRATDVDERRRALERVLDVARPPADDAKERDDTVAEELVEHAAGIQHLIARLRVEEGED